MNFENFPILAPSLLASDFADLGGALTTIEKNGGGWVHIDVMDGSFVPNITIGQPVISSLRKRTSLPFDVHLMINNPECHIESFAEAGADYITFHYENTIHHNRIIQQIHDCGKKAGISIVPSTPVSLLEEILPFVDLVLVMTVNPGFGGQKLILNCLQKLAKLKKIRHENEFRYILSVDGGVNPQNIEKVIQSGADVIVSGSSFFSGLLKWELKK